LIVNFEIKNFELLNAIKYSFHVESKLQELQDKLDLANAYQRLRVDNVKVVMWTVEDIKRRIAPSDKLDVNQLSEMIVKAS
jgi:hypothetical protein